jgi:excisionase family DNA binding protein
MWFMPAGNLLTRSQVAEILQVTLETVRRWTDDGQLPVIRFGRLVRYDPRDVEAFIRARKGGGVA